MCEGCRILKSTTCILSYRSDAKDDHVEILHKPFCWRWAGDLRTAFVGRTRRDEFDRIRERFAFDEADAQDMSDRASTIREQLACSE